MGSQYILCQLSNFQTNSKIHLTSITWALKSEGISQNLAFTPVFSLFMKKHTSYSLSRTVVSEFCEASKQTALQKLYLFLGNTNLFLYFLSPPFCKILYHLFTKKPESEKAHVDPSCYVYWNWWKGKWEEEGVHGKTWELEWPRHRSQQMQKLFSLNFSELFSYTLIVVPVLRIRAILGKKVLPKHSAFSPTKKPTLPYKHWTLTASAVRGGAGCTCFRS